MSVEPRHDPGGPTAGSGAAAWSTPLNGRAGSPAQAPDAASVLAAAALAGVVASRVTVQAPDAASVLAAAREAIGGEKKLAGIKTLVATGRTRQIRGNNLVPIEFEIAIELPDKYVRTDEIPAQESGPTSTGFNGDRLIQLPAPPEMPTPGTARPGPAVPGAAPAVRPPGAGTSASAVGSAPTAVGGAPDGSGATPAPRPPGAPSAAPQPSPPAGPPMPPPDPRKARVATIKQDFVRLTLGLFATSFSSYPLTFTLAGQAEAPQGKADIIDAKGDGTFRLRLFVNSQTHLPIMVSWTVPATTVVLKVPGVPPPDTIAPGSIIVDAPAPPAPTASKEDQDNYAKAVQDLRKKALASAKPVEHRIYYADYRDAGNGLQFPFRIRRAIAGETVEELNFDGFKINPRIDQKKFQTVK